MLNAVELAVFSGQIKSICEEMGLVLQRSAFSPNIKDRLDYSCAFFDCDGKIVAQAAHIPVHLGSMAYAMTRIVSEFDWKQGDVLVLNDPFKGGTHLPDVTLIAPFFVGEELSGFVANRAHHANIGCDSPGSMPLSTSLEDEGVIISPQKLYSQGKLNKVCLELLSSIEKNTNADDLPGDFIAQLSANVVGLERLEQWFIESRMTRQSFVQGIEQLNDYGKTLAANYLERLPKGRASFSDYLDGDGVGTENILIKVEVSIDSEGITLDFTGTSAQVKGNLNCPLSVCAASVYYVFAALMPAYVPHCDGVFKLINISAPSGSLLNALPGAAVSAGNVETSMRVVDVVLGALHQIGLKVPAASQGTMNNVAMGGTAPTPWNYYETIAGGAGAGELFEGITARQCHMTNTLNTPIESLELHYPMQVMQYGIRAGSGGIGEHSGGDGVIRSYLFKQAAQVTLLTERRSKAPWGLEGGAEGCPGKNVLNARVLDGKAEFKVGAGDVLTINTPGGGAWGEKL
ncbi:MULTISPECIES: hydantoinase B/oxoprolinase family protein [unclassified Oleiphilus]|nr:MULTISPECIES: hydantoinase B/oxoprolinase family protein [unclassified Oleiphilus]KZY49599.1 5-oxoprolinase [Oleiphilus sp. HI0050]KZY78037.1 5-oxoprolinase [Oleiphilus sp. HI0068]KZY79049.1 5-oxoprolinase [Oleiphilus sp. HI0069]KZY87074.1 5-oxoprolinase [Oleiphilus sp. HI0072]KZZ13828.1 5-oxoprolinase [Oleiphilus sp. HI0078]